MYRLDNISQRYGRKESREISKHIQWMMCQMEHVKFDPSNQIQILEFVQQFQTACDQEYIKAGAAMWSSTYFMKQTDNKALNYRIRTQKKSGNNPK